MIVITTMSQLPEHCYECPMSHECWCYASKDERGAFGSQSTRDIRPYNCPLKIVPDSKGLKFDKCETCINHPCKDGMYRLDECQYEGDDI